jgi:tight adherence protein B
MLDLTVIVPVFAIIAVAIAFGVIWYTSKTLAERRIRARLEAIKTGTDGGGKGGSRDVHGDRRKSVQAKLKEAEARRTKKGIYKLREEMIQAGLEELSPGQFLAGIALAALVATAVYYVMGMPFLDFLGLAVIPVALMFGLPKFVLGYLIKRRTKEFTRMFADGLDVIIRGVKAGLPVPECISIIGREMPDPVGSEFRLISEGTRLGMTIDECLERAVSRVPTPELRFFAIVLMIQRQTGGNLADTLGKLSDVLRGRKRMRDKVQAMSSEAKASASIIGSLPIVVGTLLALVAPDYIGLLFTTATGHKLIAGGMTWMGIGIFVMNNMISFDM